MVQSGSKPNDRHYRPYGPNYASAFTLIELSIVILVLALLAAAAISYSQAQANARNLALLNTQLDAIETDIVNYVNINGRLPCPADNTLTENTAAFGVEAGTPGDGGCTGANYSNSGTDPDGPGGSDPGAPDALYNATNFAGNVAGGALPTKTLMLPDDYAFDPWGRMLAYAVDKRMTATNATTTYSTYNTAIGNIAIKTAATDTLGNAITNQAVYAIVSFGPNGHGGVVRNFGLASSKIYSPTVDTNTDELKNCHCDGTTGNTTAFDRIFVQKNKFTDPASSSNGFDDIVRFKTRANLLNGVSDLQ